jgi:hypothetical protein
MAVWVVASLLFREMLRLATHARDRLNKPGGVSRGKSNAGAKKKKRV